MSRSVSAGDLFCWRVDQPSNPMVINAMACSSEEWSLADLKQAFAPAVSSNIRFRAVPKCRVFGGVWLGFLVGFLIGGSLGFLLGLGFFAIILSGSVFGASAEFLRGCRWEWSELPSFSIDDYIRQHTLPEATDEALYAFVNSEASHMLPHDKPLWRVILLLNTPAGGSVLLLRLHHVIGDGAGLTSWFMSMCSAAPNAEKPAPTQPLRKRSASVTLVCEHFYTIARKFVETLLMHVMLDLYAALKIFLLQKDSNSPFKGPCSGKKVATSTLRRLKLPVNEVKQLGHLFHSSITVNDVLCTLMAGAFRRLFSDYCHLHPDEMALRVIIPVNTRSGSVQSAKLENRFTLVYKALPINKASVRERLELFHLRMGFLKRGIEPAVAMQLTRLLSWMPQAIFRASMNHYTARGSAVMTNVQGSAYPLLFAGHTIGNLVFWVPTSGDVGLGISFGSYCNEIVIGVIADQQLFPDLEPLMKAIDDEWAEMKTTIGNQVAPLKTDYSHSLSTAFKVLDFSEKIR